MKLNSTNQIRTAEIFTSNCFAASESLHLDNNQMTRDSLKSWLDKQGRIKPQNFCTNLNISWQATANLDSSMTLGSSKADHCVLHMYFIQKCLNTSLYPRDHLEPEQWLSWHPGEGQSPLHSWGAVQQHWLSGLSVAQQSRDGSAAAPSCLLTVRSVSHTSACNINM